MEPPSEDSAAPVSTETWSPVSWMEPAETWPETETMSASTATFAPEMSAPAATTTEFEPRREMEPSALRPAEPARTRPETLTDWFTTSRAAAAERTTRPAVTSPACSTWA